MIEATDKSKLTGVQLIGFRERLLQVIALLVLVPACVFGLLFQLPFMWMLCPQSLVVMFSRQAMRPPDSLGAADLPDLAVAAFYYPIVSWLLIRAVRRTMVTRAIRQLIFWHLVAMIAAISLWLIRNTLWSGQLGN
jgi:hypothetical protein